MLASQEAIFIKPQFFFTLKIKCQLKVIGPLVSSSMEWRDGSWGLFSMAVKMYVWFDVEEETNASNSRLVAILNNLGVINL